MRRLCKTTPCSRPPSDLALNLLVTASVRRIAIPRTYWPPLLASLAAGVGLLFCFPVLRFFIDLPSFLITVGGTAAVTFLSFSSTELSGTALVALDAVRRQRRNVEEIIGELHRLASVYRRGGVKSLEAEERRLGDPFMRVAVARVADWQSEGEMTEALVGEIIGFERQLESAGKVLHTVGKLLPAFGLIGTLISLVLLLQGSGGPDPLTMAPSLSLAVLTTLYGALLANAVVVPLATKVETRGEARLVEMGVIAEGALLMARNERPAAIAERLATLAHMGEMSARSVSEGILGSAAGAGRPAVPGWMRGRSWTPALWRFDLGGLVSGRSSETARRASEDKLPAPGSEELPAISDGSLNGQPASRAA